MILRNCRLLFPRIGLQLRKPGPDMGKYRYARDYVIREDPKEDGRIRKSVQYAAAVYEYDCPWEQVKKTRTVLMAVSGILWAAYLGGMIPVSTAMKTLYAALPYALCGLWIALYTRSVVQLYSRMMPLTRQRADLLNNQFPASCMFACIFSFLALAGECIRLCTGGMFRRGDLVWIVCGAVMFAAAAMAFRRRSQIRLHPAG